ncbi:hypothetical protein Q5530_10090 [Saccharothrix sp. BKS2]|uniref:hypothetical protein n=1 Tax=Saccharothrix sp. BKS2 TaxID=3064400 RepID=UPI0039E9C165
MRPGRGLAAAVALVAAASSPAGAPAPDDGSYAYATADEVVVMRGERVVTRWREERAARVGPVVWTDDGRHAAFLTSTGAPDTPGAIRRLVTVDARSGNTRSARCDGCTGVAAPGGGTLLVGTGTDGPFTGLLALDPGSGGEPAEVPVRLPPLDRVELFSGTGGEVLLGGVGPTGAESWFRVRADGSTTPVGSVAATRRDRSGQPYLRGRGPVAAAVDGAGNTAYAVAGSFRGRDDRCGSAAEVFAALPAAGSTVPTDLSAATPADTRTTATDVLSLWWDPAHRLRAAVLAGVCDGTSALAPTTGEWLLERNRWVQVSAEPTLGSLHLRSGSKLVTRLPGAPRDGASLVLERGGRRTAIASGVRSITAPGFRPPGSDEVLAHLCDPADPVCLSRTGGAYELASTSGDLDGDGAADRLAAVQSWAGGTASARLEVAFADGREEHLDLPATVDLGVPRWIGATDLTGDGRAEVLVPTGTGAHSVVIGAFEHVDGRLARVGGDLAELVVGGSAHEATGVECLVDGDRALVRTSTVRAGAPTPAAGPAEYVLTEVTYAADPASGRLVRIAEDRTTSAADGGGAMPARLAGVVGVHCPGVPDVF